MYSKQEEKTLHELSVQFLKTAPASVKESLDTLIRILHYHEWRYYVKNDPIITDKEYDQLYQSLVKIEKAHPEWIQPDSPTQRIGSDLISQFQSVPHRTPMLSLDNSYNEKDLDEFDTAVRKLTKTVSSDSITYCVEPKFDGGTIVLLYENDVLIRGATRGDGVIGEEVTNNIKTIRNIPLRAAFHKYGMHTVELRGEALMRKDVFLEVNKAREEDGLSIFANPRNAATGGLRMKDPKEVADRRLDAFVYQISFAVDRNGKEMMHQFPSHHEALDALIALGFKVPEVKKERALCKGIAEVHEFCQLWEEKRDKYPYELDGMVIKVDAIQLQDLCGSTSHHPRWAMAFKFKARQARSKLLAVEFQVGKVGSITPVAKIEPVQVAGVTVSSISLHNADFIEQKELFIGDTILIERAGDVIPYIVKSFPELRKGGEKKIQFPKYCPFNTHEKKLLIRPEEEAAWRCVDCTCGQQDLQRIIFFAGKHAMDIEGLGKSICERFQQLGWLKDPSDIYRLDEQKIATLEGFGAKSAANLKAAIEASKHRPLHRLLAALSIHHLGKRASRLLAERIQHLDDLKTWSREDFMAIPEVGPVLAENVVSWLKKSQNIRLLDALKSLGVNMLQTKEDKPSVISGNLPLSGKTILFTGTLSTLTRTEAEKMAEQAGATCVSGVSKKLDILVVGADAGSKLTKAQAIGTIQILDENAFIQIVEIH